MVSSQATSVAQYLREADPARRPALLAFRRLIRAAAPEAKEGMSYGMPGYTSGKTGFAFQAQKHYYSFYFCDVDLIEKYARELRGLDCGKCCLRGRKLEHFPLDVLARMVREAVVRDRPPPSMARASGKAAKARPRTGKGKPTRAGAR